LGKRGPRPTPQVILEARGSDVPQRRKAAGLCAPQQADEFHAVEISGVPSLDQARQVVTRAIIDAGVMGKGNELAVEAFAQAIVRRYEVEARLNSWLASVDVHSLAAGDVQSDTLTKTEKMLRRSAESAEVALMKHIREFGLTPASISEVSKHAPIPVGGSANGKALLRRGL